MPGYLWLVLSVVLAVVATAWITFTATRLDRLHARVDAAQAALDAQLVRRAAALQHVADSAIDDLGPLTSARLAAVAHTALIHAGSAYDSTDPLERVSAENDVTKATNELATRRAELAAHHGEALREMTESANKVVIARRFYNDAVRDTRTLRAGRMPRLLRLAGHRSRPEFFDIDDSTDFTVGALHGGSR